MSLLLAEFRAQLLQLFIFKKVDIWSESWFFRAQQLFELFQVRLLAILALRQYPLLDQRYLGSPVVPIPLDEMVLLVLVPLYLLFNFIELTKAIVRVFGNHRGADD